LSYILQTQTELDRMLMKSSIEKYGVMDSVKVWAGKWVIVDGHNRVRICKELGIPYPVEEIELADIDAAKKWMKEQQLGRRNLTPFARCEMVLELEPELREEAAKNQGKRYDLGNIGQNFGRSSISKRTAYQLADMADISHTTFDRAKELMTIADDSTLMQLRAGTISIHKGWMATKWFLNDIDKFTKRRIEIIAGLHYKPVVWLTDSLSPDKMGIDEAPFPEHDKTRIRLEIPMLPELGILRWRTFADANDADPDCRKKIERGMNHHSWYVTEQEVPFSAVIGIYDYHKRQAIPMPITKDTLVSLLDNVSGIHCRDYKIYSVEDWLKDFVTG